jgi:hypothetical protein
LTGKGRNVEVAESDSAEESGAGAEGWGGRHRRALEAPVRLLRLPPRRRLDPPHLPRPPRRRSTRYGQLPSLACRSSVFFSLVHHDESVAWLFACW